MQILCKHVEGWKSRAFKGVSEGVTVAGCSKTEGQKTPKDTLGIWNRENNKVTGAQLGVIVQKGAREIREVMRCFPL